MLSQLPVGSVRKVRIKLISGYLVEQQKFVFSYLISCLIVRLREGVSSVQETGSKGKCLSLLVPFEKLHPFISSKKEL